MAKSNTIATVTPTVTPAAEWRRPYVEGVLIELPNSGNLVRIRPVNTDTFIRSGRIPNNLSHIVTGFIEGKQEVGELTPEGYLQNQVILDAYVLTCFVEPKVVESDPGENEITPDVISDEDKMFLFMLMGKPARALEDFRPKPNEPMDSVDGRQDHGAEAQ